MIFQDTISVKLFHQKEYIRGFGYYDIASIFWWFAGKNKILYHYNYPGGQMLTNYMTLQKNVTKHSHQIIGYDETNNSLILKKI